MEIEKMKSKIKKYSAVILTKSYKTGIIKERGFVDYADAEDEYWFLYDIADDVEIFYRLDWDAGVDMPEINAEYWFGKRDVKETE